MGIDETVPCHNLSTFLWFHVSCQGTRLEMVCLHIYTLFYHPYIEFLHS